MKRSFAGLVALSIVVAACGGGTADGTTTSPPATITTAAGTTTTGAAATTTTGVEATTSTGPPRAVFTVDDLPMAVLTDGDPWVVPVVGTDQLPLNLDVIWSADSPEERLIYEDAEFERGYHSAFVEADALLSTGAHLFAEPAGANAALELLESSFGDTEGSVARITDFPPGALITVEPLASDLGDRSTAVRVSGPHFQVVGVIWIQGNLLQFVRVGMHVGDPVREAAAFVLAEALADRVAAG